MLYMLLSLSLGWTLGTTYKNKHFKKISKKPAARVVCVLAVIQVNVCSIVTVTVELCYTEHPRKQNAQHIN